MKKDTMLDETMKRQGDKMWIVKVGSFVSINYLITLVTCRFEKGMLDEDDN